MLRRCEINPAGPDMGRIFFDDNPWPAGHAIKAAHWSLELSPPGMRLHLHLESEDYGADGYPEGPEDPSDWDSPGVWGNFHACTMSSTKWSGQGLPFPVPSGLLSLGSLAGTAVSAEEPLSMDSDDRAVRVYLLGHDSVGHHEVSFGAHRGDGAYELRWNGRLALTYIGDNEFRYRFRAAFVARFDGIFVPEMGPDVALEDLEDFFAQPDGYTVDPRRTRGGTWFVPRPGIFAG
jgi:hypothetical protein